MGPPSPRKASLRACLCRPRSTPFLLESPAVAFGVLLLLVLLLLMVLLLLVLYSLLWCSWVL